MLRNILIIIGLSVALDPYLGFPQSIDKFILTGLGLATVFLLTLSRRERQHKERAESTDVAPKILHVERTEVEDSPRMHIERTTTLDTREVEQSDGEQVMTEKKTTVVRRRKQKSEPDFSGE
jgi:hypothetical protein